MSLSGLDELVFFATMSHLPHYNLERLQRRQSDVDFDLESKTAGPSSSSEGHSMLPDHMFGFTIG